MSGIVLDFKEFDRALIQYAAASKKDFAEISNRQMQNLAIQGVKLQKAAETAAIRSLENKDFWPKVVAKVLSKKQGHYTRQQARKFSKTLIRRRLVAVKFLKFFFVSLSQAAAKYTGKSGRAGKKFAGMVVSYTPATSSRPTASATVSYAYRLRTNKTVRKAERLITDTLARAIPATAADMISYANRKMGLTAKKHSAKGAR